MSHNASTGLPKWFPIFAAVIGAIAVAALVQGRWLLAVALAFLVVANLVAYFDLNREHPDG